MVACDLYRYASGMRARGYGVRSSPAAARPCSCSWHMIGSSATRLHQGDTAKGNHGTREGMRCSPCGGGENKCQTGGSRA